MEFQVAREIRAPPEFAAEWWLEHGPGREPPPGGIERRIVPLTDGRTRVVTEGRIGSRPVRQDGVLSRESPTSWVFRSESFTNGRLFAREESITQVRPATNGCTLSTTFRFSAVGWLRRFLLWTALGNLRRRREEAFDRSVAALERALAAARRETG